MSYLDNTLVHAKEIVRVLEAEIAKEHQLVEKQKVVECIIDFFGSGSPRDEYDKKDLIKKIKEL